MSKDDVAKDDVLPTAPNDDVEQSDDSHLDLDSNISFEDSISSNGTPNPSLDLIDDNLNQDALYAIASVLHAVDPLLVEQFIVLQRQIMNSTSHIFASNLSSSLNVIETVHKSSSTTQSNNDSLIENKK